MIIIPKISLKHMQKKLGLIGAGNMAYFLLEKLSAHFPIQLWNRTSTHAFEVQKTYPNITLSETIEVLIHQCDIIFLALHDDELVSFVEKYYHSDKIFIHHSGTQNSHLNLKYNNIGSLWPIYSIVKAQVKKYPHNIPIVCTCSDKDIQNTLHELAQFLTDEVIILNDEQKKWAHLIAVMTNNFIHHLLVKTQQLAEHQKINFDIFLPIINQTVQQLNKHMALMDKQTGPAKRRDHQTISAHLDLLQNEHELTQIYQSITDSIIKLYQHE